MFISYEDPSKARRFFIEQLGFQPGKNPDELSLGDISVIIIKRIYPFETLCYIQIPVFNIRDYFSTLSSKQVEITEPVSFDRDHDHIRWFIINDPEGRKIEFVEDIMNGYIKQVDTWEFRGKKG